MAFTVTDSASALSPARRMWAVGVIACVMVLELIDMTVLNVAIPTLRDDFGASPSHVQWMVAGYTTVFALLLITTGRLGDIFGYKRMLMLGMAGFTLSSLLCGIAPTPDTLVAARLLQGFTGALMVPQGTSLIQVMFAPHERMKPLAIYGLLGGLATMLGPVIGGAIIGANWFGLGWRPIFLVNLPIGLAALVVASLVLPEGRSSSAPKLDWTGTLLSMAALFALLFPLIQGNRSGWPLWSLAMLAAAVPLGWLLVRHTRGRAQAGRPTLIEPAVLKVHPFRVGLSVTILFQIASTGFIFILPVALQSGLGLSATDSGLAHLPMALAVALGIGLLSRRLLPRLGTRMMTFGSFIMIAGIALVGLVVRSGSLAGPDALYGPMFLTGFGMGLVVGPLPPCTLSDVDVAHAGAGSGLLKTVQQLGAALGVALVGNLFFSLGGSGTGAAIIDAYLQTLVAIAALLLAAGLLALRFPGNLRLLAPQSPVAAAAP
ncbi:MFS transporter [Sphingomonas sp. SUN039]|uniref:MFS transporter n=1 Tax=Sphingomonas sp. SUN039 TaxID=2937787 RepID=UPI0021649BB9|nr:MFS transporter [Sphingomonas sp. SUN039]UVO53105.1 MFS transporter [Sphingomonas sp. SUN039]